MKTESAAFKRKIISTLLLFLCIPVTIFLYEKEIEADVYWLSALILAPGELMSLALVATIFANWLAIQKFGAPEMHEQKLALWAARKERQSLINSKAYKELRNHKRKTVALTLFAAVIVPVVAGLAKLFLGMSELIASTLAIIVIVALSSPKKSSAKKEKEDKHPSHAGCGNAVNDHREGPPDKNFKEVTKCLFIALIKSTLLISFIFIPLAFVDDLLIGCIHIQCRAKIYFFKICAIFISGLQSGLFKALGGIVLLVPSVIATGGAWVFLQKNKMGTLQTLAFVASMIGFFNGQVFKDMPNLEGIFGVKLNALFPLDMVLTVIIAGPALMEYLPKNIHPRRESPWGKILSFALNKPAALEKWTLCSFCTGIFTALALTANLNWYLNATAHGDIWAEGRLGLMYYRGLGVYINLSKAHELWLDSAEKGNSTSQYDIGGMYEDGVFVPQSYATAAEWYRKSADQGHYIAQYELGRFYQEGLGVTRDLAEARKLYSESAAQGNHTAQQALDRLNQMQYQPH